MQPTRRDFLKLSTLGGTAVSMLGFDLAPAYAAVRELKIARTTETRSTCPGVEDDSSHVVSAFRRTADATKVASCHPPTPGPRALLARRR